MTPLRTFLALTALAVLAPIIATGLVVTLTPRHPASVTKGRAR